MKMKNCNMKFVGRSWVLTAVVFCAGLLNAARSNGQEAQPAPPASKADASAKADAPAKSAAADDATKKNAAATVEKPPEKAAAPPTKATETVPVSPIAPAATTAPPAEEAPRTTAAASTEEKPTSKEAAMPAGKTQPSVATKVIEDLGLQEEARSGWSPWVLALVILALFVLPIMAGNYLAKIWRMPDHAWKLSLVIGTTAASILICLFGEFKFGPDLAGGITLIYELADAPTGHRTTGCSRQRKRQTKSRAAPASSRSIS